MYEYKASNCFFCFNRDNCPFGNYLGGNNRKTFKKVFSGPRKKSPDRSKTLPFFRTLLQPTLNIRLFLKPVKCLRRENWRKFP